MRMPYALWGILVAPILVAIIFVLKAFCLDSSCLADKFAVPVFMPLIFVYKMFGEQTVGVGSEVLFVLLYWSLVGCVIGFILDIIVNLKKQESSKQTVNNEQVYQ